jgi:predicted RNA-binding protein associated with RNAse of E/G family
MRKIELHYRRPPDRLDIFVQELVVDRPDVKITLHENTPLSEPLYVGRTRIYEPGAPLVWFVFPHAWHDVGRFHLRDGTFTGYYINLITPVTIEDDVWSMFDLCLDIWVNPDGTHQILDRDEFDEAVDRRWIDRGTASRARSELDAVIGELVTGRWPRGEVAEFDLGRVRTLALGG